MDITSWLQISLICFLGAISPGPSLALIMGNTMACGRTYGVATSIGHGTGIGWWAFLTAVGVVGVIVNNPSIMVVLQLLGACLLVYIGFRTITARNPLSTQQIGPKRSYSQSLLRGAGEGFLLSVLNPKVAIFFLAIFSHTIHVDATWVETVLIGGTAAIIDAFWYISVALVLTGTGLFESKEVIIRWGSGLVLILVALYLLGSMLEGLL